MPTVFAMWRRLSRRSRRSSSDLQDGIFVSNGKAVTVATQSASMARRRGVYTRAFLGLMLRDLFVLRREIGPFIIRVGMNPLLFLFVFTYVMPHMSGGAALNPTANMAAA